MQKKPKCNKKRQSDSCYRFIYIFMYRAIKGRENRNGGGHFCSIFLLEMTRFFISALFWGDQKKYLMQNKQLIRAACILSTPTWGKSTIVPSVIRWKTNISFFWPSSPSNIILHFAPPPTTPAKCRARKLLQAPQSRASMYAAINEGFLWAKESTDTLKIYYFDDVRVKKNVSRAFRSMRRSW